ncbi:MAG: hypothetical protein MHMPM18_000631 [Marteilia pararefringens]
MGRLIIQGFNENQQNKKQGRKNPHPPPAPSSGIPAAHASEKRAVVKSTTQSFAKMENAESIKNVYCSAQFGQTVQSKRGAMKRSELAARTGLSENDLKLIEGGKYVKKGNFSQVQQKLEAALNVGLSAHNMGQPLNKKK